MKTTFDEILRRAQDVVRQIRSVDPKLSDPGMADMIIAKAIGDAVALGYQEAIDGMEKLSITELR